MRRLHLHPAHRKILHRVIAAIWLLLAVPTILWWHESVLWVAFCSLYANSITHWGVAQSASAEVAAVSAQTANVEAEEVTVRGR
jgi:hypothetical protein